MPSDSNPPAGNRPLAFASIAMQLGALAIEGLLQGCGGRAPSVEVASVDVAPAQPSASASASARGDGAFVSDGSPSESTGNARGVKAVVRHVAAAPIDPRSPCDACRGRNDCKGLGGCKVAGQHDCAKLNDCKSLGGCGGRDCAPRDGKGACASKPCCKGTNDCKGRGNCKTTTNACKGLNQCKGRGGCKGAGC